MLKKERIAFDLLDNSFRKDVNSVRLNTHNTLAHELAKTKLSYILIKSGNKVLTEAVFKNGARADILDLSNLRVYEILHSEKEKEALRKEDYYPQELDIVYFKSDEILDKDFVW